MQPIISYLPTYHTQMNALGEAKYHLNGFKQGPEDADDPRAHDVEHGSGFLSEPEHNSHPKASDLPHHGVADAPLPSIDPSLINNSLNTATTGVGGHMSVLPQSTGFGTMPVLHPSCFQPMQFALPQSVYMDPSHRRGQGSPVQSESGPASRGHHANNVNPNFEDTHAGSEGAVAGQSEPGPD